MASGASRTHQPSRTCKVSLRHVSGAAGSVSQRFATRLEIILQRVSSSSPLPLRFASCPGKSKAVLTSNPFAGVSEEAPLQPVGLTNQGATCYLNTLLQTLYHCIPFREAVNLFNDGTAGSSGPGGAVVLELQRLFAHMDHSVATACDTKDLVRILGLDPGYQQVYLIRLIYVFYMYTFFLTVAALAIQDPIECWKLLGGTIEEAFKATGDDRLARIFEVCFVFALATECTRQELPNT